MAMLGPIFALLGRFVGKLLNTLFGWATVTLFGRVPEGRQLHMSIIAFGSVLWMVVLLGIIVPKFGVFVLSFVPIPEFVSDTWIRLAMLGLAILLPLLVGVISVFMTNASRRPKGAAGIVKTVLRGYPYTVGLAISLLLMLIFVPFIKLVPMLRRMDSQHVPVLVEAEDYPRVVDQIQGALREGGWKTRRRRASWMVRLPTKVLTFFAAGAIEKMVAKEMVVLKGNKLEVTLHPADLLIVAPKATVRQVRSHLAEQLAFSDAHLTWSTKANEIEDRLTALSHSLARRRLRPGAAWMELRQLELAMRKEDLPYEEWEVLFRNKLLVERAILQTEGTAARVVSQSVAAVTPLVQAAAASGLLSRLFGAVGGMVVSVLIGRFRRVS